MKSAEEISISSKEEQKLWQILSEVKDPEIPALSIVDLGIVRSIQASSTPDGGQELALAITPTYSGCPAMDVIQLDIRLKLLERGYTKIVIRQLLTPAWTTDWITEAGRQKLKESGIAPPNQKQQFCTSELFKEEAVQCPYCHSHNTLRVSWFGSTACKAIYQCKDCEKDFDYFKCH